MTGKRTILLVDDDPDIRQLVALALDAEGYAVKQADNGKRGIQLLTGFTPALIILDMMMPEMNGLEFCRQLVKYNVSHIPILVVSAVSERARFMQEFFELPIQNKAFINKPFDITALTDKVKEMLAASARPAAAPSAAPAAQAPPSAPAPTPPPAAKPAPAKGDRLRVLFIDDEEDIRNFMRIALSETFEVEVAENGMVGLQALDVFQPHLVICDVVMPVLNGLRTVAAIRNHPKFHDIPVFFLSGERREDLPQLALDRGGNLFIPKPLNPLRLIEVIKSFVDEMGLHPGPRHAGPPTPPPAPAGVVVPPRVLTIDSNVENMSLLKEILGRKMGPPRETLWSEEPRAALGNLHRWEPDIILYNPRQKVMEGIEFAQALDLKKPKAEQVMAFIGKEFLDADLDFSRRRFGREPIRLDQTPVEVEREIMALVRAVVGKARPKRHTLDEIDELDAETGSHPVADQEELRRKREILRERYRRMQQTIDKQGCG